MSAMPEYLWGTYEVTLREHLSRIGHIRTPKRRAASLRNLEKARDASLRLFGSLCLKCGQNRTSLLNSCGVCIACQ